MNEKPNQDQIKETETGKLSLLGRLFNNVSVPATESTKDTIECDWIINELPISVKLAIADAMENGCDLKYHIGEDMDVSDDRPSYKIVLEFK